MDRRSFLTAKKKPEAAPHVPFKLDRTNSGLNPYQGAWTRNEIRHLLKRTMFGAKKADIDYFLSKTLTQSVNELLTIPSNLPSPPVKTYNNSTNATDPDNAIPLGSTWVNTNTNDGTVNSQRVNNFKNWWIGLMINQQRNVSEKMVLFWHNLFATEADTIGRAIWCYQNNTVIRNNVLGNFKQFVKDITLDTGMLRYLNGYLNTNTAPDENYARELQELFTVGKGIDGNTMFFTENDVKAAARVLTGYSVNGTTNIYSFTAGKHDSTNKQFSSFYNNTVITGRTGAAGMTELDDMLTMIFTSNEVALHLCRKLYQWFVYYDIDASTEANVIAPMAQILRNNNYQVKPVLIALFSSEHFFDVQNQGCQIKSPLDKIISLCREMAVSFPVLTDYISSYNMWDLLRTQANSLQQNLANPPSVAGWPAYHQAPQFYEIWINSDTFQKRNQFTDTMANTGYTRAGKTIKMDPVTFAKTLPNPGNPTALVDDSVEYLFRIPLSDASKEQIKKDILLSGQAQNYYWTDAWVAFNNNPNDMTNANIVKTRLRDLYQYLMKLAEYQLA